MILIKKLAFFLAFFCWAHNSLSCSQAENVLSSSPKEGWVVFATEDYFDLLEVAIASVHAFSTRSVLAFGVNADIPFSLEKYPRLIKKRIDVDLSQESIFFQKPRVIYASGLDYGVYIEADDTCYPDAINCLLIRV